jgi:hypothetical protein
MMLGSQEVRSQDAPTEASFSFFIIPGHCGRVPGTGKKGSTTLPAPGIC